MKITLTQHHFSAKNYIWWTYQTSFSEYRKAVYLIWLKISENRKQWIPRAVYFPRISYWSERFLQKTQGITKSIWMNYELWEFFGLLYIIIVFCIFSDIMKCGDYFLKVFGHISYKLVLSILTVCLKICEFFVKENQTACLLYLGVCIKWASKEQGSTVIDIMLGPVFTWMNARSHLWKTGSLERYFCPLEENLFLWEKKWHIHSIKKKIIFLEF